MRLKTLLLLQYVLTNIFLANEGMSINVKSLKKYVKRRCPNCKIILYSREHALKHVCRRPKTNKTNTQNEKSPNNDPLDDIIIDESITKTPEPGARPNRCLICKIRFINQDHALKHICRNLTPKEIVCRHCGAKFETGADKQKHILEFHKDLRPYMCEKCPRTFIYPLSLEAHRRSHNSEQPFRCTICNQSFKHRSALNTHKLDHGVEHKHSCPVCDEGFNKYSQLKHHLKQHPEIDGVFPPYLCPECGVTYTTHKSLQEHLQTIHMGTEKYACPVCNKEFKSKGYLRGHMVIHSQDNKYECQFCGKKCKTWGNRSAHIKIHHSDDRPYVCEICTKSFKFSGRLKIHLRQHNNEKPYSCTQCSMSFVSSSRLRGHMAVHGEKAVYECSLCDKKFSKKSVAVKHFAEHEEPVGMDT
ncbi:zinc finger protein OZF-like [Ctenocephalides felis]|uniref:zinc finger protein OZF-like n=1 Tax=Ctenocephalides felis TaxID=7515 RepID=UPI000E6E4A21|nr:zinc finger protein OZF-like [Ctenocephalides felis]